MKLAVVTGGNRGLGLEISRQLAARGVAVVLAARDLTAARSAAAALASVGAVEPMALDVTDPASISALAAALAARGGLDILVNNAAIALDGFDAEVARRTIATNFTGVLATTEALLPLLRPDGRVVMMSSGMADRSKLSPRLAAALVDPRLGRDGLVALMAQFVDDVAAGRHRAAGWPSSAYSVSKAGVNALTAVLARALEAEGNPRRLLVNAVCPGWVRTAMGGPSADRSVEEGAETPVWAALLPAGEASRAFQGGFFRDRRPASW
jgi:carbonyl reductase 1